MRPHYEISGIKSMNVFVFYLLSFIMLWTITLATIIARAPLGVIMIFGFMSCLTFWGFIFNFTTVEVEVET